MNFILGTIALVITLSACNKNAECQRCMPKDVREVELKYTNSLGDIDFSRTSINTSRDSITQIGLTSIAGLVYSKFNESINNLTKHSFQTIQTVLFIEDFIEGKKVFNDQNIKAISRISKSGNLLYHTFYIRKGDEFILEDKLSTEISILSGNSLIEILNTIVFPLNTKNSFLVVNDIDNNNFKSKNRVDLLMKKIKNYQSKNRNTSASIPPPTDRAAADCGAACDFVKGSTCDLSGGSRVCRTKITVCRSNFIKTIINSSKMMSKDSMSYTFDSSLHYSIKNNILVNSIFGQKYLDYYYDLGEIYEEHSTISNTLKTARLLYEMNTFFSYLNNNTRGNQIFLTSPMKAKITNLITEYKSVYNDDYTETIFQDILKDLNWAENKPVTQVMTRFS